MTSYAGVQMPVTQVDGTGQDGKRRRTRAVKGSGLPLILWADLRDHPGGLWKVGDGVIYLLGTDMYTPNSGGVSRTYTERPDAYAVDEDGAPLRALMKVPLEQVAAWDELHATAEADKKTALQRDAAILKEYVGRKQRDYAVARIAGTVLSGGVHIPTLRMELDRLGVKVTRGGGSRVLASFPSGPSPHSPSAARLADIAARYGDLLVEPKLTCDVARCTKPGEWVTNSGAVICSRHAGRP